MNLPEHETTPTGANDVTPVASQGDSCKAAPSPFDALKIEALNASVVETLRTVFDPEIPVNIYELGLIYSVDATADGHVDVTMTLTSPMCPVAGSLPPEVETKIKAIEGVRDAKVELVWDPPWTPDKMTEAARLQLNI